MSDEYGEFEEKAEIVGQSAGGNNSEGVPEVSTGGRVRMPRRGDFIGMITQRLGGNRMEVVSTDGKTRNCRVPGRYKRSLWLRPNDIVMITPWVDDDGKGDVIYKYSSAEITQLRKRGILDSLKREF